jgi:hypothetical protein
MLDSSGAQEKQQEKDMPGLLLHCGGQKVDFEAVQASVTPEPQDSHYPIPHARILELAVEGLEKQGLHVVSGEHALDKDGMRYFGLLQLTNGANHSDFGLVAALRNTHDKSYAASMALGSHVFVCDNLAFSGEVTFARKHTRFAMMDMPRLVNDALGRLGTLKRSQEMRIEGYKGAELTDDQAYATIVRATMAKVIPNARIRDVVEQWHEPAHEEFAPRTGWSLFNGFTEILKRYPGEQLPARTQVLHGVLDSACGLSFSTPRHVVVEEDINALVESVN